MNCIFVVFLNAKCTFNTECTAFTEESVKVKCILHPECGLLLWKAMGQNCPQLLRLTSLHVADTLCSAFDQYTRTMSCSFYYVWNWVGKWVMIRCFFFADVGRERSSGMLACRKRNSQRVTAGVSLSEPPMWESLLGRCLTAPSHKNKHWGSLPENPTENMKLNKTLQSKPLFFYVDNSL